MWTAVFIRAKIHPKEVIVFWTDKIDESHLNATDNGLYNVIFCVKKLDVLEFFGKYKKAVQNAYLASFNILESADTFSQWTTIASNDRIDLSRIDNKIFENVKDAEMKLSEDAEENGMDMIDMMEYGDNDVDEHVDVITNYNICVFPNFFRTYVKKFSKKIFVFNCPE